MKNLGIVATFSNLRCDFRNFLLSSAPTHTELTAIRIAQTEAAIVMSLSPDFPHDTSDIGRMLDIQLLSTGIAPVVEARSAPLVVTSTANYTYNPSVPLETAITYGLTLHQAIGYANDGDRIVFAEDITSITLH